MTIKMLVLSINEVAPRSQGSTVGSRTDRARPPEAIRCKTSDGAIGTIVDSGTQELERPRPNQSGGHETKFHVQQATLLLALISEDMSSGLSI